MNLPPPPLEQGGVFPASSPPGCPSTLDRQVHQLPLPILAAYDRPVPRRQAARSSRSSQARQIVLDLYAPNQTIYFLDFGLTILLGHAMFVIGAMLTYWLPEPLALRLALQAVCFARQRALLVSRPRCSFTSWSTCGAARLTPFRLFYHIAFGVPCFLPSFIYYTHLNHHRSHYGTPDDAEYVPIELPLAAGARRTSFCSRWSRRSPAFCGSAF